PDLVVEGCVLLAGNQNMENHGSPLRLVWPSHLLDTALATRSVKRAMFYILRWKMVTEDFNGASPNYFRHSAASGRSASTTKRNGRARTREESRRSTRGARRIRMRGWW